jgi:hypothetical protein
LNGYSSCRRRFDSFKYNDVAVFPVAPLTAIPATTCGSVWGISPAAGGQPVFWTGAAVGQIDTDVTFFDVWSISTATRALAGGNCDAITPTNAANPAGEPANETNDVNRQ